MKLPDLEFDMADVKPSVINWLIVGLMAVTFIIVFKYVFTQRFQVPGLTPIAFAL